VALRMLVSLAIPVLAGIFARWADRLFPEAKEGG
jgi:hypothetical protein